MEADVEGLIGAGRHMATLPRSLNAQRAGARLARPAHHRRCCDPVGLDYLDRAHACEIWRKVTEQLPRRWRKLADLMDAGEHDVLAYLSFPRQHTTKLHSTNAIERLNKEVKRPNEASAM